MKPAFVTFIIARPLASRMTADGIALSGIASKRSMIAAAWSTSASIDSRLEVVAHAENTVAMIRKIIDLILGTLLSPDG
jgi:hypothetical protein